MPWSDSNSPGCAPSWRISCSGGGRRCSECAWACRCSLTAATRASGRASAGSTATSGGSGRGSRRDSYRCPIWAGTMSARRPAPVCSGSSTRMPASTSYTPSSSSASTRKTCARYHRTAPISARQWVTTTFTVSSSIPRRAITSGRAYCGTSRSCEMLRPRITPCLLVHNGGLVKTVQFIAPRYVGDPLNAVKIFNEKEADELIVLDIDASVRGSEPNYRLIANLAVECRMPLCYGGGIKTAAQAKRIVGLGVEKVSISSAAIDNPTVISRMAEEVGSQSVIVVFDVRRSGGGYEVWTHNGSRNSGKLLDEVVRSAESLGAGEILVNSIDNDGQMTGYDL